MNKSYEPNRVPESKPTIHTEAMSTARALHVGIQIHTTRWPMPMPHPPMAYVLRGYAARSLWSNAPMVLWFKTQFNNTGRYRYLPTNASETVTDTIP